MVVKVMVVIMMIRIIMKIWEQLFSDVLQNRFFSKVREFHRKTPVLELLFNKVAEHFQWLLLKIVNSSSYLSVLPIVAKRQFHQFFYKN